MKNIKLLCFVLGLAFLLFSACASESGTVLEQSADQELLSVSDAGKSEENSEEREYYDLFAGSTVNVLRPLGDSGENVPRDGEPFIFSGAPIEAVLSVGSYSSFDANAKVFAMLDGEMCHFLTEKGGRIPYYEFEFEPVEYGDELFDNSFVFPICVEPVFTEAKDRYDLSFFIYVYDKDRKTKALPDNILNAQASFCSMTYDLLVNDASCIEIRQGEGKRTPDEFEMIDERDRIVDSECLVKLSADADPNVYNNGLCTVSDTDKLYLHTYFKQKNEYLIMLFIDGGYYKAFGDTGTLIHSNEGDSPCIASTEVYLHGLSHGMHRADVLTFDLTNKTAYTHSSYVVDIG